MEALPVVFSCSPRAGGNSDAAAACIMGELAALGRKARLVRLRDTPLRPCQGCYGCRKDAAGRCVQPDSERAGLVYEYLLTAPQFFFTAPIYFYHLPGLLKDFIDRSQPYYLRREAGEPDMVGLPARTACSVLVAGRPKGEKLFDGAVLTMKFFLRTFNITLAESLNLRGIDLPGDLEADAVARPAIREMVGRAVGGTAFSAR